MGATCQKLLNFDEETEIVFKNDMYRDIKLKKYKSPYDSYFHSFDENVNLLKYINIIDFASSLTNFTFASNDINAVNNVKAQQASIFSECVNQEQLMLFLDNKLIKHHCIYDLEIDPEIQEIFSEFLLKLYETVRKGYLSYLKQQNLPNEDKKPKKYFLLAKGILLCGGDNLAKLDIIFSVFKNDANKLEKKNLSLHLFIFITFLIATYAIFKNIDDLSPLHPNYLKLTNNEEEKNKIYEKFEVQRIINLKENFMTQFFGKGQSLSYYEFREKIVNEGQDWFLSASGIRLQLDNNNINLK